MFVLISALSRRWLILFIGGSWLMGGQLAAQGGAGEQHPFDTHWTIRPDVLFPLWVADSIPLPDGSALFRKVVGFFGPDYQRFEFRMTALARDSDTLPVFSFAGKTRFRDTVRAVTGLVAITVVEVYPERNGLQTGYLTAQVRFTDRDSGFFEGELTTYFVLDQQQRILYDALLYQHPTFSNNACTGLYRREGQPVMPCHWGDFRVPDCGDLDVGAAQFVPNARYYPFGWERYVQAWLEDADHPDSAIARAIEMQRWWK